MNRIITISREFGSGGRTVGKKVAEQLGIPCYDSELIQKIAEESGFAENYVKEAGEYTPGGFLASALSNRAFGPTNEDILWEIQCRVISELAEKGPCVIVGRCADFVLRSSPRVLRIFCCCDRADAVARCVEEYDLPESEAEAEIERVNRNRSNHYEFYTGQRWSDPHHYDLMVNTGHVSLEAAAALIRTMYRERCGSAKPSGTK